MLETKVLEVETEVEVFKVVIGTGMSGVEFGDGEALNIKINRVRSGSKIK